LNDADALHHAICIHTRSKVETLLS
jgi:hypothetical protein